MKNTKQITPTSHEQTKAKAEVIKLGIDIHKRECVVVQQIDGIAPKSPQRFKPDEKEEKTSPRKGVFKGRAIGFDIT